VKTLIEQKPDQIILLDVREPHEYKDGYIPTALNVPITSHPDALFLSPEEFQDRFGFSKPPLSKEVVFYCKSGVRSSAAAQMARQQGYSDVAEYRGSWLDWTKNGGSTSKGPSGKGEAVDSEM
jgi:rhodanese-related sulfurtransferase